MIVLLPGSIRVLHDLAEFDDLVVRAQYVEVTDAVAPEGVDVLDGAFREVQIGRASCRERVLRLV